MKQECDGREKIVELGKRLMLIDNVDEMIPLIAQEAKILTEAERCSIFIADTDNNILWTTHSDEIDTITIPLDSGIVGEVYTTKQSRVVNSPKAEENFMSKISEKVNYDVKNLIAVPIFNSKQEVIAVLELLNKNSNFDQYDIDTLSFLSNFVSGTLELWLREDMFLKC